MQRARLTMFRYVVYGCLIVSIAACSTSEEENKEHSSFSPKSVLKFLVGLLEPIRPAQPNTIANLDTYAEHFIAQGKYDLAERHYWQALAIRETGWGPEHLNVLPGLEKLAKLYTDRDKYTAAEPLLYRALALREKIQGPSHPDIAPTLEAYAVLLRKMQRNAEAIAAERRVQVLRGQ